MNSATLRGAVVELPLELVDDPELPARENMDDAKFAELVDSIKAHGLIQPVSVKPRGERYEILAGHRRYLACKAIGLPTIAAVIRTDADASGELIKAHENAFREELNPAEEAVWFKQLLDRHCGGDIDELARLVGHPVIYLNRRFDLLRGDEEVFAAVHRGSITMAVAIELNKFQTVEQIRSHLDAALRGGATAPIVREWRRARARLDEQIVTDPSAAEPHVGGLPQAADSICTCLLCKGSADPHQMRLVYIHTDCLKALRKFIGVDIEGFFYDAAAASPASARPAGGDA